MIQFLRGTASQLQSSNTVFAAGQPIFESDSGQLKIGNGANVFADLPYVGNLGEAASIFDSWQQGHCMVPGYWPENVAVYFDLSPHLRIHFGDVATSQNCTKSIATSWNTHGDWQTAAYRIYRASDNTLITKIDSLGSMVWASVVHLRDNDYTQYSFTDPVGTLQILRPTYTTTWNDNTNLFFQYIMITTDVTP